MKFEDFFKKGKCKSCTQEINCKYSGTKDYKLSPSCNSDFELKKEERCKEKNNCLRGNICKPNEEMFNCLKNNLNWFQQKKLGRYEMIETC